jgi:ubiquinone/menaquinone biosynthesis C-methylase UbiE
MKKETADKLLKLSEDNYDAMAEEFSVSRPFFWRELGHFADYVKDGDKVLDVGCGNGRILDIFEDKTIDFTGIDSSGKLIEIAKQEYGNRGTFYKQCGTALHFDDESFDVLYSLAVIHHIPSKEYRELFVRELYRTLKPGGTLIITTWNLWHPKFYRALREEGIKKLMGKSELDWGDIIFVFGQKYRKRYLHAFTQSGFKKLLEGAGLPAGEAGFEVSDLKKIARKSGYANIVAVCKKPV